jgi:predicted O-methyltransferase YrrM
MEAVADAIVASLGTDPAAPAARLHDVLMGLQRSMAVWAAARLGLADLMAGGPRAVADLAEETGSDAGTLARLLRALAAEGVLVEAGDGRFALAPCGELLRSDAPGSLLGLALLHGVAARAWLELPHTLATGEPGFPRAFGSGLYAWLAEHPEERLVFDRALACRGRDTYDAIVGAWDFSRFETVVEVGGGHGALIAAVLAAHPSARGLLLDRPESVAGARTALAAAGLDGRCRVVGGDFFREVPTGGDLYVLSSVLNDWDDEAAARILASCRRAMRPGARLVAFERVVPDGAGAHPAKLNDLNLLVMLGGRERTATEFEAIFAAAGLAVAAIAPTPTAKSAIEAAPA